MLPIARIGTYIDVNALKNFFIADRGVDDPRTPDNVATPCAPASMHELQFVGVMPPSAKTGTLLESQSVRKTSKPNPSVAFQDGSKTGEQTTAVTGKC